MADAATTQSDLLSLRQAVAQLHPVDWHAHRMFAQRLADAGIVTVVVEDYDNDISRFSMSYRIVELPQLTPADLKESLEPAYLAASDGRHFEEVNDGMMGACITYEVFVPGAPRGGSCYHTMETPVEHSPAYNTAF